MVGRYQNADKVGMCRDDGIQIVKLLELPAKAFVKVFVDGLPDDVERMS